MSIRNDTELTADEVAPHFDRRTALATLLLVREYIKEHPPLDFDAENTTAQDVVADMVLELRSKIKTSEHWRGRLLHYIAREKR